MKKLILLTAICLSVLVGCQKSGYNCHQKITTSMVPDSVGFPQIQYSEFQLTGNSKCIVGTTSTETPIDRSRVKIVTYETTCE